MAYLIWEGPSELDGLPIYAALSGLDRPSENRKTGPMAQLWIQSQRTDPIKAVASGADYSVCGNCALRGVAGKARACYVNLGHAPPQIHAQYSRKTLDTSNRWKTLLKEYSVRLGAYGDPAALPIHIIQDLVQRANAHTGYTHQWRTANPELRKYVMASVESAEGYHEANALGWSTFRVKHKGAPRFHGEFTCPASAEAGSSTTCSKCLQCSGGNSRNFAIDAHGAYGKNLPTTKEVYFDRTYPAVPPTTPFLTTARAQL